MASYRVIVWFRVFLKMIATPSVCGRDRDVSRLHLSTFYRTSRWRNVTSRRLKLNYSGRQRSWLNTTHVSTRVQCMGLCKEKEKEAETHAFFYGSCTFSDS